MTPTEPRPEQPQRPPRLPRLDLHGVLLLDKPLGMSSNDALMVARRLLRAKKAGHTGTLDPLATGLLPLCFGEATKFSQDLLDADKTYEAKVTLGSTTSTGDAEGEILSQSAARIGLADLQAVVPRFLGAIEQIPPMHSALKKDGKPLYAYARAGQTVEREARRVTIHALDILETGLDNAVQGFTMRVRCSKGTYIRTLAEDIGRALGCGAYLSALRRTGVGDLVLNGAITLDSLQQQEEGTRIVHLAPVDALLQSLARVDLPDAEATRFQHGQRLPLRGITLPPSGTVRVYDTGGRLLGIAELCDTLLRPKRLLHLPCG